MRLFRRTTSGFELFAPATAQLGTAELRQGAELAIEATDIVRDLQVWDGYADITLEITARALRDGPVRDVVRLRVSQVMAFHHLSPARTLFASRTAPGV